LERECREQEEESKAEAEALGDEDGLLLFVPTHFFIALADEE